ncbi:MAG TPA: hypothetical protein VJY54_02735 [Lachnospiraceae bacterium]|nr:hypothetical protein [Lachnospiraceae bacterium]
MSKLIVYGKGKGNELIPTRGIGDYFYYAMWIADIWNVSNKLWSYVVAFMMIFLGTTIDYFIIGRISKKGDYKGFPATVIPFVCVAV